MLLAVLAMVLVLGTFLSNTAVANLVLPVAIAATTPVDHKVIALAVVFMASLTVALPVSGPPNAMAYARGELKVRDMFIPGALLGAIGALIIFGVSSLIIHR